MKYYKLLKDLPTFKAGDEFYISEKDGGLVRASDDTYAYSRLALEKCPNILKDGEWFEKMPEESKRWRAKRCEKYHFINDCGVICAEVEWGDDIDGFRHATGDYFKTEEEAEAYKEYLLAKQVLLDDAKGFVPDWKNFNQAKFEVFYDHGEKTLDYSEAGDFQTIGAIYFGTEEDIRESFEKHKDQWEIVRKYEMGSR